MVWIWTQNTFFFKCFMSRHSFFKLGGRAKTRHTGGLRPAPLQYWANQLRGKCKHWSAICALLLYGFWLAIWVTWLLYLISLTKTVVSQKALPSIHASVRFHDAVKYDFCMTSRPQYYLQLTHSDALVQLEVILQPCGCTKIIFDNIMAHDGCKNFRQRFLGNRGF